MKIAAIDIGTNSIHMIVVRIGADASFEVVDREKEMVRLGTGSLEGGALTASSIASALRTLERFKRIAESRDVEEIIATATSAVRESQNGADFVAEVARRTGLRVRVISGTEEARLIHLAATHAAGLGPRRGVVIDIGGGSVEITCGTSARMQAGKSFKLGVLRLTEKCVQSDPLSARHEARMVRLIRRETRGFLREIRRKGFDRVIGTSGTIQSLAAVTGAGPSGREARNLRVSAKAITRVRKMVTSRALKARRDLPGLDPARADLVVAGAVLLDTLLTDLRATDLSLCDFALREGLVLDYARQHLDEIRQVDRYPDVRRRSVIALAERCDAWGPHARHVAKLSLKLFDALAPLHGYGLREREWLEYASLLHDIGVHISYERHHKHSSYLIRNGDLRGFEPGEVDAMALIARYHRQGVPRKSHEGFRDLDRRHRKAIKFLSAVLRLAEGLERSHTQVVSGLQVATPAKAREPLTVRLRVSGDAELELWAAARHVAPLAEWLGRAVEFHVAGARALGRS